MAAPTTSSKVPPPQPWILPDGSPTVSFFNFITSLFKATSGGGSANKTIQSNISGTNAVPVANTISAILDVTIDNVRGDIIVRGAANWQKLVLGGNNTALVSNATDLVYAAIVNSLAGGNGVTVSGSTGAVTLGLGSALTLASGAPASITTAGGDLLLDSFTHNLQLGTTSVIATVSANFVADHRIQIKDGAGNTRYLACSSVAW